MTVPSWSETMYRFMMKELIVVMVALTLVSGLTFFVLQAVA